MRTRYYNDMFKTYKKEKKLSWANLKKLANGRLTVDVGGMVVGTIGLLAMFI